MPRSGLGRGVLGASMALYLLSAAPTLLWGDDAELQRIAITGESRAVGQSSAASHLLWQTVAGAFVRATAWLPVDAAGRVTLVSAIAGAIALLPFAAVTTSLGQRAGLGPWAVGVASAVGTAAFGFGHTFWLLSARPDAYTVQVLLLATALWGTVRSGVAVRPWLGLAVAALAVGAALTNHVIILASVPGLALLGTARLRLTTRQVVVVTVSGVAVVVAGVGLGQWLGFPVWALVSAVASYRAYIPSLRDAGLVLGYLLYQFPVALVLTVWAWVPLHRLGGRSAAGIAAMYLGVVGLMLFRYHPDMYVRDQYIFYLPSYLPVAICIGLGAGWLVDHPSPWLRMRGRVLAATLLAMACAPVVVYPLAASIAGPVATRLAPARTLPGRDPVWYYLWPPKTGYTGARDYVTAVFATLPPGAVVVADWLPYQTLRYVQAVEGGRPDVRLEMINAGDGRQVAFLKAQPAGTPLFLADVSPPPYYEIDEIRACFDVLAVGVVYRLDRKAGC